MKMPERGEGGRFLKAPPKEPEPFVPNICPCGTKCLRGRTICEACRVNSAQKARMQYQLQIRRWKEKVDREAEAETANLKKAEALPPVVAESIINRWLKEG